LGTCLWGGVHTEGATGRSISKTSKKKQGLNGLIKKRVRLWDGVQAKLKRS